MKSPAISVPLCLLLAALLSFPMLSARAGEREDAAVVAAKTWLGLIDDGKYAASWEDAAPFFKDRVPEGEWEKLVAGVRGPLGALKSRELSSAKFMTSLSGAPDGEYVVIQFQASFANKAAAVETVTPMLVNGQWKVSGYFVR